MDASAMSAALLGAALLGARGARGTSACGNDPLRFRRERRVSLDDGRTNGGRGTVRT